MTSRKITSVDTPQRCSTTDQGVATDPLAISKSDIAVDQSRFKILLQCMRGQVAVGEIAEMLDLSQSLVSHHLRLRRYINISI